MLFGEKLKKLRVDNNLTQEELANVIHVSRGTISSWEVGRTYPNLDIIVSLSDYFEVSLDQLLREDVKMVKNISKEVSASKRYKRLFLVLLILFLLWIAISIFFYIFPQFDPSIERVYSMPITNIERVEKVGEFVEIKVVPQEFRKLKLMNVSEADGILQVHVIQKGTLFKEDSLKIDISEFSSNIEAVELYTDDNKSKESYYFETYQVE
ncbi:helix-turn-helix domain-containing protein [Enterococcus sp. LJL90]